LILAQRINRIYGMAEWFNVGSIELVKLLHILQHVIELGGQSLLFFFSETQPRQ
jgi:hypothetical protein